MKYENKNILGTTFTLLMLICSMFASLVVVAPAAYAENGIGEVTAFQTDADYVVTSPEWAVQTVDTEKDLTIWLQNDELIGGDCIDEIIITLPDTWQQSIDVNQVTVTNMGDVIITNEADVCVDNPADPDCWSDLENDPLSVRIVPDPAGSGVMLCPQGTTEIVLTGHKAPMNPEMTEVMITTSDENHNEDSSNYVRQPIDVLPQIQVSGAKKAKIEYIMISDFASSGGAVDYVFTATAKGAWGMLDELYVKNNGATTSMDVYLDDGDGTYTGADWLVGSESIPGGVITTVLLDQYDNSMNVGSLLYNGYIKDGSAFKYYIVLATDYPIDILGHADSARYLDPSVVGTGFEGNAFGTVIEVNDAPVAADGRKVKVQIVQEAVDKDANPILLDVKEEDLPIYYTTTLGAFTEASPEPTDANGQIELTLLPGTVKGIADVNVCFPDPECVSEYVGINARPVDSCAVTSAPSPVEAGVTVEIEATLYDEFGNVITNMPSPTPNVEFDLTQAPPNPGDVLDTDASLDDDTSQGTQSWHEEENSDLGTADTYLHTSATVGDHIVAVQASYNGETFDCGDATVTTILGQGGQMECTVIDPLEDSEITADQCFDVLVRVLDENGNPLPKWESIVEVELVGLDKSPEGTKYIKDTDMREEMPSLPDVSLSSISQPDLVKGKLNNDDGSVGYAWAIVEVCGCEGLGQFDVECRSNSLEDDSFTLDVINSDPECIDLDIKNRKDDCDDEMYVVTSILDTCGNKLVTVVKQFELSDCLFTYPEIVLI